MERILTLNDADRVAARIAELELEITLTNTRFDLKKQRLDQRKAETNAPLVSERDALYADLEAFATRNPNCLKKKRLIPGGTWGISKGRYSTRIDDAIFDPEGESERFGTKLYTTKPDLDAIGKLLEEGEEVDGAWRELGLDKVKVTPDKKLPALRVAAAKAAESEQQKKA